MSTNQAGLLAMGGADNKKPVADREVRLPLRGEGPYQTSFDLMPNGPDGTQFDL